MGGSHEAIDMDFRADLRVIIEAELDALGYEPDPQLPLHKLTNLYFDALTRRISPRPRQVIRARDFSCPPAHAAGLAQLVTDIETGADLAPRLSRSLDEFEFIDGMLVEWGIYHFHLGTTPHPKRPGLIQSTGDLVYAIVSADTVYFLAVLPHRQWSNERLLQVIEENWPSLRRTGRCSGRRASMRSRRCPAAPSSSRPAWVGPSAARPPSAVPCGPTGS
jgi:hypothetical protein